MPATADDSPNRKILKILTLENSNFAFVEFVLLQIVKIDRVSSAKRVAFESARNLAMVGYTAKAKVMNAFVDQNGTPTKIPESNIIKAFEAVGESELKAIFDWNIPCSWPCSLRPGIFAMN